MGFDLALGGLVLITAIRGWLKGFLVQAIRLAGLVASVYVAVPVRDECKPYVVAYLPTLRPELIDRLLWWCSALVSYFVLVGVASLIVAVARRPIYGIAEPNRGDQLAGFGLGLVKGLVAAAFVVAGLQKYAAPHIARVAWAEEQSQSSTAWEWNQRYRPAARIWATPAVRQFVAHVQRMGLNSPASQPEAEAEVEKPVQTASRAPKLEVPATPDDTAGLDPELVRAVEQIRVELQALEAASSPK